MSLAELVRNCEGKWIFGDITSDEQFRDELRIALHFQKIILETVHSHLTFT